MNTTDTGAFEDIQDGIDLFLSQDGAIGDAVATADAHLAQAEAVLEAWLRAKSATPTTDQIEGYRLLALHRQGARGDASFNACRETCREIVFLRNVVSLYDDDPAQARHHLRLQAMVLRHLALFVGGKLVESGLGDFCCASRPVRAREADGSAAPDAVAG